MQQFSKLDVRLRMTAALLSILLPAVSSAAEPEAPIYGHQLMTQQERRDYREQMRSARSWEEREHHERMRERARAKGVTLPDSPPARGPGAAPGAKGPGGTDPGSRPGSR